MHIGKKITASLLGLVMVTPFLLTSCGNDDPNKDNTFNLFTVEDDKALGAQFDGHIMSDSSEFNILPKAQYGEAYTYIEGLFDKVLNSGELNYRDEFNWTIRIVQDDSTLNAFATPGGYIYIYTGLIKYLDFENELVGVIGHEIAHSDRRHSTDQLTKQYGISLLLGLLFGDQEPGAVASVLANLTVLRFSRAAESEADEFSVRYLCSTDCKADGAAGFFEKLNADSTAARPPEFLSTHPDPGNRVEAIKAKEEELACPGESIGESAYANFKTKLP